MAKKPTKPKKPKAIQSLSVWQKFDTRMKEYNSKVSGISGDAKKKLDLIKKYNK